MHYLAMKLKGIAMLGLISALLLGSTNSSFADQSPSPTPSPTSTTSSDFEAMMNQYKVNLDKYRSFQNPNLDAQALTVQYKSAIEIFRNLQDSRDELRSQINRVFMASVDKANKEARTAMKSAKTASAKNDVIAKQKIAITAASDARDYAIAALGALPAPPVKPIKQVEPQPIAKTKAEPQPGTKTKTKKSSPTPSSESEH
jgi:hypothetical protein